MSNNKPCQSKYFRPTSMSVTNKDNNLDLDFLAMGPRSIILICYGWGGVSAWSKVNSYCLSFTANIRR